MNICKQCVKILNYDVKSYFFPTRPYVWSVLKPADFDKERHLSWRYAKSELEKLSRGARKRPRCEDEHGGQ